MRRLCISCAARILPLLNRRCGACHRSLEPICTYRGVDHLLHHRHCRAQFLSSQRLRRNGVLVRLYQSYHDDWASHNLLCALLGWWSYTPAVGLPLLERSGPDEYMACKWGRRAHHCVFRDIGSLRFSIYIRARTSGRHMWGDAEP